ncbi:hypothetical protein FHS18_000698 [Paenibacillus phyllosphaerae]|uniref:Uncharacterized protein n=1 Tax=Paenibacillus phyllosphaerae TaxID=274593 RepID=A0A7W5FKZ3_9BACL|nr:hypothetical protein [Paenibacillus phyllosphaerae]
MQRASASIAFILNHPHLPRKSLPTSLPCHLTKLFQTFIMSVTIKYIVNVTTQQVKAGGSSHLLL